jgi:hypothetical protein
MAKTTFEVQLAAMGARVEPLERLVHAFAVSLPKPLFYHSGKKHYGFRYAKPTAQHFCLLKAARVVSALNAALVLVQYGYTQEIGVLMRTVIEYTTHIEFVLDARDDVGTLEPKVEKYVQDYFADFARDSSTDFKGAQVRQTTVNKRLGVSLDNLARQSGDGHRHTAAEQLYSNIYLTYSNYVHAKYPEVMDLYGGEPGRFHLRGMHGTSKDHENLQVVDAFITTASNTFRLMVVQLKLHQLVESDAVLSEWFRSS